MEAGLLGLSPDGRRGGATFYAFALFFPALCMFTSFGASLLAVPLLVQAWGMDPANMAYLNTVKEVSELVANAPASAVLVRLGARRSMLLGSALYAAIGLPLSVAPNFACFAALFLVQGAVVKVYNRGQGAVIRDACGGKRGSISGALVTCRFLAMALAPHLTARLAAPLGGAQRMYLLQVGLGLAMVLLLMAAPASVPAEPQAAARPDCAHERVGYAALAADPCTRRGLLSAGAICSAVSVLRGAYGVVLPLAGLSMGLSLEAVSMSMTVTYATAGLLSFAGGRALDSYGLRACAQSAMACFAMGHGGLALAASRQQCSWAMAVSAVSLGVADAISAPLVYTLKGDSAWREGLRLEGAGWPPEGVKLRVARFQAALDMVIDAVGMVYPIVLGLVATRTSVALASWLFAAVAVVGGIASSAALDDPGS